MAVNDDAAQTELNTTVNEEPTESGVAVLEEDVTGAEPDSDGTTADPGTDELAASPSRMRPALITGAVVFVGLVGLAGWTGYGAYQAHQATVQKEQFVAVARQGAVNLTTIDYQHADDDVKRILDSATGTFYDDFNKRSEPFLEVVKKVQSKSVGTIVDAGLETQSGDAAQVLVAVNVKTTVGDGTTQDPRSWRMRISVQKVGNQEMKVSDVTFVP